MSNLEDIVARAGVAFRDGLGGIESFCSIYKEAIRQYGQEAKERFAEEYPCFSEREWDRFMLVADGKLKPMFLFRSDSFVRKLLREENSRKLQVSIMTGTPESAAETSRNINRIVQAHGDSAWCVRGSGKDAYIKVIRGFRVDTLGDLDNVYAAMRRSLAEAKREKR